MDGGHSESNRGSFFQRARSWLKYRGSFFQRACSRLKYRGSFFQRVRSRLKYRGSFFQRVRSWLKYHGSFFQRVRSRLKYRGSFFQRVRSRWGYRGSFFQKLSRPRSGGESRKIRVPANATHYHGGVRREVSILFLVFVRLLLFLLVFLDHHCDHAPYEPDDYADDHNDDAISNGRTHSLSLFIVVMYAFLSIVSTSEDFSCPSSYGAYSVSDAGVD